MTDRHITINGRTYSPAQVEQAIGVIAGNARGVGATGSDIVTPGSLRTRFGEQYGGDRDVWDVLGYDDDVDAEDYRARYRRQDVARRIVELPATDTWRQPPTLSDGAPDGEDGEGDGTGTGTGTSAEAGADDDSESAFEAAANQLLESRLAAMLKRVDIAAGIGEFGLLFIGFADGADDLGEAVVESAISSPDDVAYYSVFAQDQVDDWTLGKDAGRDPTDPLFNRPVEYELDFADLDGDSTDEDVKTVHHSRVVHVAEGPVESDLKGTPRLRPVYNRLVDLEKVVGASAEMFWAGADRKYHLDVRDAYDDTIDLDNLDDEVQRLVQDLQPYLKTTGVDVNVIGGEEVDPSGVVQSALKFVSGATGIPLRKLVGSERGEQASTQDRANWFDTVESRQHNFGEPQLLRPTIDRHIGVGALPEPAAGDYEVEWPSLFSLTEVEQSEVAANRAQALRNAAPQGNTDLLPGGMDGVVEFLETGAFPDQGPPVEPPLDEDDDEVVDQFARQFGDVGRVGD